VRQAGLPKVPNVSFVLDRGWEVRPDAQVWAGSFRGSGLPAIVTVAGGAGRLYELMQDGAEGRPAFVDGVRGAEVLLGQG